MTRVNKKRMAVEYTLAGLILGVFFPILSTWIEMIEHQMPFTFASFISAQRQNTLLWIIDLILPILAIFGYQIGVRQQKLINQADNLEEAVTKRSEEILRQKLFYEGLVKHSPVAIATLDPSHHVVTINPAFEEIFGYDADEIVGKDLDNLLSNPENKQEAFDITQRVLDGNSIHEFGRRRRKDGSYVEVEIRGAPIEIRGTQIGVLGLYRDITAEKLAKEELEASEERFRRMFNESPVALRLEDLSKMKQWIIDRQAESGMDIRDYFKNNPDEFRNMIEMGEIIALNSASLNLFRAKDRHHLQENLFTILSNHSYASTIDIVCALLDGATTFEKEMVYQNLDGDKVYVITKLSVLPGDEDDLSRVLFSTMDITERKLAEERLAFLSLHDMLTGLYNRTFFEEEIARLERSRIRPISILVCDVDNLKTTNDLYGHPAGDNVLRHIASILKKCLRTEDIISRIGGDEFAILLPNVSTELTHSVIQRLNKQIEQHNRASSDENQLSLSVGFGTADKGELLSEVFKSADEIMYQVKAKKRI